MMKWHAILSAFLDNRRSRKKRLAAKKKSKTSAADLERAYSQTAKVIAASVAPPLLHTNESAAAELRCKTMQLTLMRAYVKTFLNFPPSQASAAAFHRGWPRHNFGAEAERIIAAADRDGYEEDDEGNRSSSISSN